MSLRNREIQTYSKVLTVNASTLNVGGQVPAGMKRWVTFLTVGCAAVANTKTVRVYLASVGVSVPTMASLIATGNRKMVLDLRASKTLNIVRGDLPLQIPRQPNVDKPLFSIGSGKWLGIFGSSVTANVFIQYFDE